MATPTDAVALDMSSLRPAPAKVVANLPYGVAATVILQIQILGREWDVHLKSTRPAQRFLSPGGENTLAAGLLLVGGVTHVSRHAPPGAAATAQGVLTAVVFQVWFTAFIVSRSMEGGAA